ncbi:uncharacterized protein LOC120353901 [Nilaparvata lugens]|uniref:uncharacterized protein LOC120353901 n=1 Tax=Nilaparvata lugens TaxID=108931 RepID=UPI00193E3973|nr:uncharacterized protein LOC120353901 [Nilaparvata lugens]
MYYNMFGIELFPPQDLKEKEIAKIEKKRKIKEERKAKIFNPRNKLIDIPGGSTPDDDRTEPSYVHINVDKTNENMEDPETTSTPIPEQSQNRDISGPHSPSKSQFHTAPDYQPKKMYKPRSKIQQTASTARELNSLSESVLRSDIEIEKDSEWNIYGKRVAAQLKRMTPAQALTAQMEINNILRKCSLDDLSWASTGPDRVLNVSTRPMYDPSNNSISSNIFEASPELDTDITQNIIISNTEAPGTSEANPGIFSEVLTALGYKTDGLNK